MIDRRLHDVRQSIDEACKRAGRDPKEIELVLVTKEIDPNMIAQAYSLGVRDFGENRVQDLNAKQENLAGDIRWHFIGHLQTNKVKFLIGKVALIHSCDRLDLARELEKQAEKHNKIAEILIQVNASGEKTKHGFYPGMVKPAILEMSRFEHLKIKGLMTIGPNTQDKNRIRNSFKSLRILREQLKNDFPNLNWHYLSMGMSSDFEIAIEEGANLLRIGTAVFGPRVKNH